jgi:hypothetical protein
MERAWLAVGSVVTVAALVWGSFSIVGLLAHEEVTERAAFDPAGIERIDMSNDNGSIEVQADDVAEITLVAEIDHGLRRTGHRADVQGSTLVVRGSCPHWSTWCEVDYRLVVPADLDVVADMDNGRITLRDLAGDVEVRGDNGPIELDRITGDVRARTSNGSVDGTGLRSDRATARSSNGRVTLSFARPPTSVQADTSNGPVEVVVPDGPETYHVRADTDHGATDVDVRTDPGSDRSIDAETSNGSVTVRYASG